VLCRIRAGRAAQAGAYTRIAAIDSEADVTAVRKELSDRYDQPPEPVLTMLEVARLRAAPRRTGLTDITAAGPAHQVRAGGAVRFPAGLGAVAVPMVRRGHPGGTG
jgi:transcription-repair coupling factor (superfamily II helicase)